MWAIKTFHPVERVRNFHRHKRLILAFLLSAVLVVSIIYMGSFSPIARSVPDGVEPFEILIYIKNATLFNVLMKGSYKYGSLYVTNVTMDIANISEMTLITPGGGGLEVPSAFATKLSVYTTFLTTLTPLDNIVNITLYGYQNATLPGPEMPVYNTFMKVVYMHAESFCGSWLSLIAGT